MFRNDSSATNLLVIMVCTIDGEEVAFGVAAGLLDRFARLEAGVLPGGSCEIGIMTMGASANYMLNLQRSQSQPSTPQPPESLSMADRRCGPSFPGRGVVP